jgi:enoyl-CoA hydratase/carnithine racemase
MRSVMSDDILYDVRDGVGTVTFNRPEARNALTFAMYERAGEICATVPADGSVKVLVFTGAGDRAFAAGTDIGQFRAFSTPQDAIAYEERIEAVLDRIERCPIPTIAAISGACTGGGASIAASCDLRLATRSARFGYPVARTLGNCLSIANYARLAALFGPSRVKELVFTARLLDAEAGERLGFYNEVVEDHAALMQRVAEMSRLIAGHAPLTMRATKEALRRIASAAAQNLDGEDLVLMCYMSDDFREGMDAFLTKRVPQWKGR